MPKINLWTALHLYKIGQIYKNRICNFSLRCRLCRLSAGISGIRRNGIKIYFENPEILIISDTDRYRATDRIMCLWKAHQQMITPSQKLSMINNFFEVMKENFKYFIIEETKNTLPSHEHFHGRVFKTESDKELFLKKWNKNRDRIIIL